MCSCFLIFSYGDVKELISSMFIASQKGLFFNLKFNSWSKTIQINYTKCSNVHFELVFKWKDWNQLFVKIHREPIGHYLITIWFFLSPFLPSCKIFTSSLLSLSSTFKIPKFLSFIQIKINSARQLEIKYQSARPSAIFFHCKSQSAWSSLISLVLGTVERTSY